MTKTLLVALEKYSRSCLRNTWRMGKVLRIWSIWKLQLSLLTFPDYSSNFTSYVDTCTSQEAKWYFPSNPRYWADLKVLIEIIEDGGGRRYDSSNLLNKNVNPSPNIFGMSTFTTFYEFMLRFYRFQILEWAFALGSMCLRIENFGEESRKDFQHFFWISF